VVPSPAGTKEKSLAIPTAIAVNASGSTMYVAAFGSSKIGVLSTSAVENDTFTPSASDHITVSGGGPGGLALDEARNRLYVLTRFDDAVKVVDLATRTEIQAVPMHSPEPASVRLGRPVLYDAVRSSSNGESSCASCHVFGDFDSLGWDLGNPDDTLLNNPNPIEFNIGQDPDFHPMKGPMTTQSLRGMANAGPMHWRGDRTGVNDEPTGQPNSGQYSEQIAFKKFNPAFVNLLGRKSQLSDAEMQAFADFMLQVIYPPNPIRNLDNSLTPDQQAGREHFFRPLDPVRPQPVKIPHLRNLYQKVGRFGFGPVEPPFEAFFTFDTQHRGDQVRGFGYLHDGNIGTIFRFLDTLSFSMVLSPHGFPLGPEGDAERRQVESLILAFDSNMAPVVGQQITLSANNFSVVSPRIPLLMARAAAGECDLVVKGQNENGELGWLYNNLDGFISDRAGRGRQSLGALRDIAEQGNQELTFTCMPPGSGVRAALDCDSNGTFDGDDRDAGRDPRMGGDR
jgi:hypothetical protein